MIDHDGQARTDTRQILTDLVAGHAALTPLGGIGEENSGHKGYGYSVAVELLSSALQNGDYLKMLSGIDENGNKKPIRLGHFFVAIKIESFIELAEFKKTASALLNSLRQSRKAPGQERIYTAGEKEHIAYQERLKTGVPIPQSLKEEMDQLREWYQLTRFRFPWDA